MAEAVALEEALTVPSREAALLGKKLEPWLPGCRVGAGLSTATKFKFYCGSEFVSASTTTLVESNLVDLAAFLG